MMKNKASLFIPLHVDVCTSTQLYIVDIGVFTTL